jgi:hypothetical protein
MCYIKWTQDDIDGLEELGIDLLWTEVEDNGFVAREIGFAKDGHVVHKSPNCSNRFGLFDNQIVKLTQVNCSIEADKFNEIWNRTN